MNFKYLYASIMAIGVFVNNTKVADVYFLLFAFCCNITVIT
ncbi:hypothetical protein GPUN_0442 [Glaciecola punicea ACAM 611]|uniref:Uncharacterized protein n=1 Tax=Glaciecola punicea ACAM 611 TaxID=1121923 RepID=H5T8E8_9ALTE|nr:hypothetical protein GPUN_0442 [Glaciecola punicea ACAM 611]